MERTVPSTGSEEIELYLRTLYSLLRSTSEVKIRTIEEAHAGMKSLLHPDARAGAPDMSAFIYTHLRLPKCMFHVNLVVLGQTPDAFVRAGYGDVESWEPVTAPARRRRCYFNGKDILTCFIASRTDIDDVIPLLTAYQIEWNKMNQLLAQLPPSIKLEGVAGDIAQLRALADSIQMSMEDMEKLQIIWGKEFEANLQRISAEPIRLKVQLLSGSLSEYRRATHHWWENIRRRAPAVLNRPIYFVSSNPHSLPNLLTGFALRSKDTLLQYLAESGDMHLQREWRDIQSQTVRSSEENYLYYLLKKYCESPQGAEMQAALSAAEVTSGITRVYPRHSFDVEAQVIELAQLQPAGMDRRLLLGDGSFLAASDALILNIDYPLGLAAYNILSKIAEHNNQILGIYVVGKAATLNGVIGDVMIPNLVHDEHTRNTYLFANCFTAADVDPHLVYGTVLDNQKAVTVRGTFLQNARFMDIFYREGYTDIEMEAGPFLSAIYEMFRPVRHPVNEIINLYGLPFDLGIIHYASDTPLSKGRNLGAGSLSYYGMDPTYAATLSVLRRVLQLEEKRVRGGIPARGDPHASRPQISYMENG